MSDYDNHCGVPLENQGQSYDAETDTQTERFECTVCGYARIMHL